jgi:hypothetical protein
LWEIANRGNKEAAVARLAANVLLRSQMSSSKMVKPIANQTTINALTNSSVDKIPLTTVLSGGGTKATEVIKNTLVQSESDDFLSSMSLTPVMKRTCKFNLKNNFFFFF